MMVTSLFTDKEILHLSVGKQCGFDTPNFMKADLALKKKKNNLWSLHMMIF